MPEAQAKKPMSKGLIAGIIAGAAAIIAAIIIIIIIVTSGKPNIVGTWKLVSAKQGDTDLTSLVTAYAGTPTITFNDDGTGSMTLSGDTTKFQYDKNNLEIKDDEGSSKIDVSGNKITLSYQGTTMVFEKQ